MAIEEDDQPGAVGRGEEGSFLVTFALEQTEADKSRPGGVEPVLEAVALACGCELGLERGAVAAEDEACAHSARAGSPAGSTSRAHSRRFQSGTGGSDAFRGTKRDRSTSSSLWM